MKGLGPSLLPTQSGPARVTDTKCHDTKGHELGSSLYWGYSITYIHGGHLQIRHRLLTSPPRGGRERKK